jgi:post-segregation antitoxin (ccd killing protein)
MRMARVNITIPDELIAAARAAGFNVSRIAASAVAEELDRRAKLADIDAYLAELEAELGPISADELAAAVAWADRLDEAATAQPGRPRRRRPAQSA